MSLLTAFQKFMQVALKYGFSLYGLPKTGQTTVYESGDDGTYKKGYPKAGARFTDNGDGTITDNATGLMWAKDGNGAGCSNGDILEWAAAISFCENLNFAGHTDWRLPNVRELQSIVDYARSYPAIDPLFTNTQSDGYWSGTTYAGDTGFAWVVGFDGGGAFNGSKDFGTNYVRAVRGGI